MVSTQTARAGVRVVIAGTEGIGKTTLMASAPRVLAVPLENGLVGVNVAKTPPLEHYDHVMMLLDEIEGNIKAGQFPYMTLAVDSATALERLIHQKVLETDPTYGKGNKKALTMESALGGYGKAYQYANELFDNFLKKCDVLSQWYGLNIILTCHVFSAQVLDPTAGEYNCWDLLLHSPKNQKAYGKREMLTQWADIVGFLYEPIFVTEGDNMNKGVSAGKGRLLGVTREPGFVAKNRFNVGPPIPIPREQGWNQLAHAIYQASGYDCYNRDVPQ
jgi:hypothetical protein